MIILSVLNRWLMAFGRIIGRFTILVLVALLIFAPLFALLSASCLAAYLITGEASLTFLVLWLVFVGLFVWYVGPFVQPQLHSALRALRRDIDD
jgi:hypothetical protein